MEYRIVTKQSFRVMGIGAPMSKELEENFQLVPALWARAAQEMPGILGISQAGVEGEFRYLIAVATDAPLMEGMEEHMIPACTWAVFPGKGAMPGSIQELEQRIFTEWLPTSGYEYANAPDIEVYLEPVPQDARFQVWVPVARK